MAAGQGRRMRSRLPKVLQPLGGQPILARILATVRSLSQLPSKIVVVYGHQGELIRSTFSQAADLTWAHQAEQKGTGHAVLQAMPWLDDAEWVLILSGDVPLISKETLEKLIHLKNTSDVSFVTATVDNPTGLGRIKRDSSGQVLSIIEEKDASEDERKISEISAGIWMVKKEHLLRFLPELTPQNAQQEYYLPQILPLALRAQCRAATVSPNDVVEVLGANDKRELARLERLYQKQRANALLDQGVTLSDPDRLDIRGDLSDLTVGQDVSIDINVILEGKLHLGDQVQIGPNVVIKNSVIQEGTQILANCVIEGAHIGPNCVIGPFARIRPGTELAAQVKIGNFVETKQARIGKKSKVNHLSYVGDAQLGEAVNVGAGTITCNYDGKNKHLTVLGDHVFIGSNTALIAPVTVGAGTTIGAGTTVVKDVPANHLLHNRIEYRSVSNWVRPDIDETK